MKWDWSLLKEEEEEEKRVIMNGTICMTLFACGFRVFIHRRCGVLIRFHHFAVIVLWFLIQFTLFFVFIALFTRSNKRLTTKRSSIYSFLNSYEIKMRSQKIFHHVTAYHHELCFRSLHFHISSFSSIASSTHRHSNILRESKRRMRSTWLHRKSSSSERYFPYWLYDAYAKLKVFILMHSLQFIYPMAKNKRLWQTNEMHHILMRIHSPY